MDTTDMNTSSTSSREVSTTGGSSSLGHTESQSSTPTHIRDDQTQSVGTKATSQVRVKHNVDEYDPADPSGSFPARGTSELKRRVEDAHNVDKKQRTQSTSTPALDDSSSHSSSYEHLYRRQEHHDAMYEDKDGNRKGLALSAWDRLQDFASTHKFDLAQVSRSTLTSVGHLPEFAQLAVIGNFMRHDMDAIQDKNSHFMRVYQDYLHDNPWVSTLAPVSSYMGAFASDPGFCTFGYAPPFPSSGSTSLSLPYKYPSAPHGRRTRSSYPDRRRSNDLTGSSMSSHSSESSSRDPRRNRHKADATAVSTSDSKSDIYSRLPPSVRSVLDALYRDGRLQESINDNVLSRLLHLPERVATEAVYNFAEANLADIGNVQGFFVGIINRVNEKMISDEGSTQQQHYKMHPVDDRRVSRPQQTSESMNPGLAMHGPVPLGTGPPSMLQLPVSVQTHLHAMAANGILESVHEFGDKVYDVLGQLTEDLANEVLRRFTHANLNSVRNRSGFLIGVVKRCKQEYGLA